MYILDKVVLAVINTKFKSYPLRLYRTYLEQANRIFNFANYCHEMSNVCEKIPNFNLYKVVFQSLLCAA